MSSVYGKNIRVSIFGQSHSPAIGVVVDGLPAGFVPDFEALRVFMARRAPGGDDLSTPRKERDAFEVVSGMSGDHLCGAPFCALIRNGDTRPGDYAAFSDTPRPGHADYTGRVKFGGYGDSSGGGHFSGRLTAPLCLAGGLALQMLAVKGIRIAAHIERIGDVSDRRFDPVAPEMESIVPGRLPVLDAAAGARMAEAIRNAQAQGDSVGGVVELTATGLPPGLGDPMFDGMENRLSQAIFAIPAVRGIEFGLGFDAAKTTGSLHNDPFTIKDGRVVTKTNNAGGILGGITNGMPLLLRVAFKPTPSIFKTQKTVRLPNMEDAELSIQGRHDPCVVPRAVPCVEAASALAILDAMLETDKGEKQTWI